MTSPLRHLPAIGALLGAVIAVGAVLTQAVGMSPEPRDTGIETQVLGEVEFNTELASSTAATRVEVLGTTEAPTTSASNEATSTSTSSSTSTTTSAATVVVTDETSDDDLAVGEAALALLPYDVSANLPDWTIEFLGAQSGIRGLAMPSEKRIEIYVRDTDTAENLVRVIAHEVGHAVDISLNSGAERDEWRAARALDDSVPWWPDGVSFDFDTGAGDFAEAFATVMVGSESKSTVGGALTEAQADLVRVLSTP